jgi:hypothetical protein
MLARYGGTLALSAGQLESTLDDEVDRYRYDPETNRVELAVPQVSYDPSERSDEYKPGRPMGMAAATREVLARHRGEYFVDEDEDGVDEKVKPPHADPVGRKVTSGSRARSGQTELHPELARFRRMHPEHYPQEIMNHGNVSAYPPRSPAQRQREAVRARAGGRDQARITR